MPIRKTLALCLNALINDEEEDTKMSAEELRINEDKESSDELEQVLKEDKMTKKQS